MHQSNRRFRHFFTAVLCGLAILYPAWGSEPIRFATFNTAMNRSAPGALADELASGVSDQASKIAEIIQRVRPDVLLINEIDFDPQHRALTSFRRLFLEKPQGEQQPIEFPYAYLAEVNTGVPSERDFDKDDRLGEPEDALGFGKFAGQYGMAVLSRFPIDASAVRTFRKFRWSQMPDAMLPALAGKPFYDEADLAVLPLSSKSHWDLPLQVSGTVIHFLVSHPTPPVFDGSEDRNGTRNHDEIRLWADYVDPSRSGYLVDDQGATGGLAEGALFVIAGDLNADPHDGQSVNQAIRMLLEHPKIQATPVPRSAGAKEAADQQGQANRNHQGDPAHDTGDFNDVTVGNLRIDYVLPSVGLEVIDAGVFWPEASAAGGDLVSASDHRLVWVDLSVGDAD